MSYKVIRDSLGGLVCFGPNDDNYVPTISAGNTLTTEATQPVSVPTAQQQRDAIQAQIDALEQKEILPRSTRIFMLTVAIGLAAQQGVTEPQLYASNYEYKKIKDFEATITALRMQMLAIV